MYEDKNYTIDIKYGKSLVPYCSLQILSVCCICFGFFSCRVL